MARPKKSNRSDGRYEIRRVIGHTPSGKAVTKSFYGANKAEAEQKAEAFYRAEEQKALERKTILFNEWAQRWLDAYKRDDVKTNTYITTYDRPCRNYIFPHFKDKILQDITPLDIKAFINSVSGLSQSYVDKICLCLKQIFEAAIDNDLIAKNPCRNLTAKSKQTKHAKRVYDSATVDALCASSAPYALYVHILLRMGLRISELCGLRWQDIDLEQKTMTVSQALTSESGAIFIGDAKSLSSDRKLPIPDDLIKRLASVENKQGYLAMRKNGRHVTPSHFNALELEVFYNNAGVPMNQRLTAHELRHTCGTLLYEETKDIFQVSKFLGHSEIGITTKIYVHSQYHTEKVHVDFDENSAKNYVKKSSKK